MKAIKFVLCLFFCIFWNLHVDAAIIYVNHAVTSDLNDGKTWATAFQDLQAGLGVAIAGDEIWVAKGIYKPSSSSVINLFLSFNIDTGVAVFGGFSGSENELSQRNWLKHLTILSGELGTVENINDNSRHVVLFENVDDSTVLDGFTISGGSANGGFPNDRGGGIYARFSSDPIIRNCVLSRNTARRSGGAIYVDAGHPIIEDCRFEYNTASEGAGLLDYGIGTKVSNCVFIGDKAKNSGGGGQIHSDGEYSNCSFISNEAPGVGGGG